MNYCGFDDEDVFQLCVPFDAAGEYTPGETIVQRRFSHDIWGTWRPTAVDQSFINSIAQGSKTVFTNKRALNTLDKYLSMHPAETVTPARVAEQSLYLSLMCELPVGGFYQMVPNNVAQKRLEEYTLRFHDSDRIIQELNEMAVNPVAEASLIVDLLAFSTIAVPEECFDFLRLIYMSRK